MISEKQKYIEKVYLSECSDNISLIEDCLLKLEENPDNEKEISELLRAIHTLKGSSGILGSKILPEFTHNYESLVKVIIKKRLFTKNLITFLLKTLDYINLMIDRIVKNNEDIDKNKHNIINNKILSIQKKINKKVQPYGFFDETEEETEEDEEQLYRLSVTLNEKREKLTWLPEDLFNDVYKLGTVIRIAGNPFKEIDWKNDDLNQCYFNWHIFLESKLPLNKIIDAFLLFKDKNLITIETPNGKNYSSQDIENKDNKSENVKQKKTTDNDELIKISSKKIDSLINIIGELIITNSNLENIQKRLNDTVLDNSLYNINKISKQLRNIVLKLKMVPISDLFIKFKRMIRDTSRKLDKKVNFLIESKKTEIDKSLFSILQDPILHILRNSIDHGIEPPEERKKLEKPTEGLIKISAYEENGQIVIEISDDGRGLNKENILKKAIQENLLEPEKEYSDYEIYNVIFKPGFSTKEKSTIISGRGIGMDVVFENIKNINGSIKIDSTQGKGTKFVIRLPLTLAIIDGFLIKIGQNNFVFPRNNVLECFDINLEDLNADEMIYNLRGNYLPVKKLDSVFKNISYKKRNSQNKKIIVITLEEDIVGILCDEILGNLQVVIRPISKIINKSMCLTGSTLLGNGDVAFIFDVRNLLKKLNSN